MNWLETVFGLSPDGGNGTFEFLIMVGIALVLAMVLASRTHAVRSRRAKRKSN